MKRSIAWGIGITLAAAALAGACGNSVTDTSGSGGGNGGNGTPSSSSKATTGGMGGGTGGTVGTGGSGGTGGGDACTKACNYATGCGEDLCSQFQLDCSVAEDACVAACVNKATCAQIQDAVSSMFMDLSNPLIICAAPCVEMGGTGGGGQGGNGAGGGSVMACENCAENSCLNQIEACEGDPACMSWFNCAMGCGFNDNACLTMCDQNNPSASANAIYACACTSCSTACAQIDPCNHTTGGGTGGAAGSTTGTGN